MLRFLGPTVLVSTCGLLAYYTGSQQAYAIDTNCYIWVSPPVIACGSCADVFNCGTCSAGGQCEALTYQVCAKTNYNSRATKGAYKITSYVPCWKHYECGCPTPTQACVASGIQTSVSDDWEFIDQPFGTCPS